MPPESYITQSLSICQYSNHEYVTIHNIMCLGSMDYRTRTRNVREDRDLTQADIGKVLNKSQQGYNHIEAGRAELKIDDLVKLCQFYNLSADYLIGLINKPKSYK